MDRQKRTASKVTDYRRYHLSGDLDQVVQGKVSEVVEQIEAHNMSTNIIPEDATPEQLQELLKEQKDNSAKLQQQLETMRL